MRLASRLSAAAVPGAVAAILLLLGLLATLQYRWAGELSEAERARLSAAARARAEGLSREFDLEVTRAWAGLQMGAAALRTRDFGAYADRYQAWHQSAAHPALVREVLLLEPEGSALPPLPVLPRRRARSRPPCGRPAWTRCAAAPRS